MIRKQKKKEGKIKISMIKITWPFLAVTIAATTSSSYRLFCGKAVPHESESESEFEYVFESDLHLLMRRCSISSIHSRFCRSVSVGRLGFSRESQQAMYLECFWVSLSLSVSDKGLMFGLIVDCLVLRWVDFTRRGR